MTDKFETDAAHAHHAHARIPTSRWRKAGGHMLLGLCAAVALLPAQAQPIGALNTSVHGPLPNAFLHLPSSDLAVGSPAGMVNGGRWWAGAEWKFNPQWESLSQS